MNAQQKVAWFEVVVAVLALGAAFVAYPLLGEAAMGMFCLLGLLGLTPLFLRKRKDQIITDERDHSISLKATFLGVGAGWMILFMSIVVLTAFVSFEDSAVPKNLLGAVLWVSFATSYAVKGGMSLMLYRSHQHAS